MTGHELFKCARVTSHTTKFVFQWFNSCDKSFLFKQFVHNSVFLVCNILLNLYVAHVLCCICKFHLLAMSGFKARLVNI